MILLVICILCNVLLGVIFKYFGIYKVNTFGAIVVNYFTASCIASFFLGSAPIPHDLISKPWFVYAFFLAATFVVGFNVLGYTFQKFGISITTIIQKMSLVIPVTVAFYFFQEDLSLIKVIGICCALFAIILTNIPDKENAENKKPLAWYYYMFPLFVFLMSGGIESALYYVNAKQIVKDGDMYFTSSMFFMAGMMGLVVIVIRYFTNPISVGKKEIIGGILLGIPNFFTIYLLVLLLSQDWAGTILFPVLNISILVLSATIAIILFSEKLTLFKKIGGAFAILAIYLITAF